MERGLCELGNRSDNNPTASFKATCQSPLVPPLPEDTTLITRTARVILGLLRQSPQSLYDLKGTLSRRLTHLWSESDGQLYPAIRELIIDELITADPQDGPRHRTPLRITEHGRKTLAESLRDSPKPDTPRDELALYISLLHERVDPSLFRHLDDELQRCLRIADGERTYLGAPDRYTLQVVATAANWLARRWVILLHETRAAWCREAITLLRELAHPELNPLMTDPEAASSTPPGRNGDARPEVARESHAGPEGGATTPLGRNGELRSDPQHTDPEAGPATPLARNGASPRDPEVDPLPPDPEVRSSTPLEMSEDSPDPAEEVPPAPARPRSRRINMLTLLEMVENGEPIPPWNG